jgi:6-phosphogluconolactonase
MKKFELLNFANADDLAKAAASAWLDEIESASRAARKFCVALSGGRVVQNFFAATVGQAKNRKTSFTTVHFFWADERCVPPSDAESNFKEASTLLLEPLKIPANQIHRLLGEDSPEAAVAKATAELRQVVPPEVGGQSVLDLVLLGMGEDGHVASLFPNATSQILDSTDPFLAIANSPKPPARRISLSYAAIAAAKQVWALVSGAGKAAALRASLDPGGVTPLARVMRSRAQFKIFSDIRLD